jgi:mitochondrial fission protein ELM1
MPATMNVVKAFPKVEPAPLVWLILGERMGDNQQVLALGKMLGWPYVAKQLRWDHDCDIAPREQGVSLIGVDLEHSDRLAPPWPDIIVAVGQRSVPASRWIVKQTGGRAINIRLGRPRIEFAAFDLIVTTPQYGLPSAPNLRELLLPLTLRDDEKVAQATALWQPRLANLPRPWTAVLVGGPTQSLALNESVATTMAESLEDFHRASGGSLLLTTSPRTPEEVPAVFESGLSEPRFLFRWQAGVENPYLALLALADTIVVTNDSISMIAEAINFGKPVYLYELPLLRRRRKGSITGSIRRMFRERRQRRLAMGTPADQLDRFYDFLTRHGKVRPRRDTLPLQRRLYGTGIVRRFTPDQFNTPWRPSEAITGNVEAVIDEIHALWRRRIGRDEAEH